MMRPLRIVLGIYDLTVAHVDNPVPIPGGLGIVGDHHDRLVQFFVGKSQHFKHDLRVFRVEIPRRLIG